MKRINPMRLPLAALAVVWVIYLGIIGPWLISAASDTAVVIGLAAGYALLVFTYRRLAKLAALEDPNE